MEGEEEKKSADGPGMKSARGIITVSSAVLFIPSVLHSLPPLVCFMHVHLSYLHVKPPSFGDSNCPPLPPSPSLSMPLFFSYTLFSPLLHLLPCTIATLLSSLFFFLSFFLSPSCSPSPPCSLSLLIILRGSCDDSIWAVRCLLKNENDFR